jgi:FAD/FMN-containing dehydrogenase
MSPPWDALARGIDGDVHLPGSPAYEGHAPAFNARFDHLRPEAIVRCASAPDVAETVRFLTRHGLSHATRSGGHSFGGHSSTRGVLVDVADLRTVAVAAGKVRVGAGAPLGHVYEELDPHGVTVAGGTCPAVGIAGLALGGGLGILGRAHGATSDQMLGAEIVLADGRIVSCDGEREPDLFWALRGAGAGSFGVVTALDLATVPAPDATSFHLAWPEASAAAVADAWQRWAPVGADELIASLKVTTPDDKDAPASVDVYGTVLGHPADADEVLGSLVDRAGTEPASATRQHTNHAGTRAFWAALGDPDARPYLRARSEFFARPLPAEAIEALLHTLARPRAPGESRELDFMPWGGAYNRRDAEATAFVHRDAQFLLKHSVVMAAPAPAGAAPGPDWLDDSWASVHPWGSGRAFQNFADPDLRDWPTAYYGANLPRLLRIKARYDPTDFFHHPQSIPLEPA